MAKTFDDIYTIGGTVQAGNGIYIPRPADKDLLTLCQAGTFAYILSARQMGKSSLMVRTAESLRQEDVRTAIVDLTQLGTLTSAEEWYLGFLTVLEDQLMLDTDVISWWQSQKEQGIGLVQRVTLFFQEILLHEISSRIVIFVDEIDTTLSLNFTDDFYVLIRSLHTARSREEELKRLSFVLIGVATPGDLIRDPTRTPFNIGQRVDVADFTFADAKPLATGFNLPEEQANQVLKWVLGWTGGHPYLTQRLCRAIQEKGSNSWTEQTVAKVVEATFFGEKSEQDNNLQFVRDMLTKRAPDETAVLTTYQAILRPNSNVRDEEQSIVKNHLKLSGVVVSEKGYLRVRNRIYNTVFDRKWLKEQLPVNWTKQAQRFFAIAAAVFVVATLYAIGVLLVVNDQATNKINAAEQTANVYQATQHAAENAQATANSNLYVAQTAMSGAEQNQQQAEKDGLLAQARLYAVRSQLANETDPELGLLLAIQAGKLVQTNQLDDSSGAVKQALINSLQNSHERLRINTDSEDMTVAYSPNGNLFAVATYNAVKLWNSSTGQLVTSLDASITNIPILKWSSDGQKILAISDNNIWIWSAINYKQIAIITSTKNFNSGEFSPDSKYFIATSIENTAELWDASSGTQLFVFQGGSKFTNSAHFSPDSKEIVTTGDDGTICIWDTVSGQLKISLKRTDGVEVREALFSPDASFILASYYNSSNTNANVVIWNLASQKTIYSTSVTTDAEPDLAWQPMPNNPFINKTKVSMKFSITANNTFFLWLLSFSNPNSPSFSEITSINNATYAIWSPTGNYFAIAAGNTLQIWDNFPEELSYFQGFNNVIDTIWSPDEHYILTTGLVTNPSIRVLETNINSSINFLQLPPLYAANSSSILPYSQIVFSPSNDFVTAHLPNSNAALSWNTASGKLLLTSQALSIGGNLGLVYNSDGTTAQVIQASTGQVLGTLNGFTGVINSAAFSPDNQKVATVNKDNLVQVWKVSDGSLLANLATGNTVSFTPDGKLVVAKTDGSSDVYDLNSDNLLTNWSGVPIGYNHTGNTVLLSSTVSLNELNLLNFSINKTIPIPRTQTLSPPSDVVFNPDDTTLNILYKGLGVPYTDKIIQLNSATGKIIKEYDGTVSISQDGRLIGYSSQMGKIIILDTQAQKPISNFDFDFVPFVADAVSIQFSPNNKIVAITIPEEIKLFNVADGGLITTLLNPNTKLHKLGFSNDDKFVAIQSIDSANGINATEIYLNPAAVTIDDLLKLAELPNRSTRQLTQDEIQTYLLPTPTPTPFVPITAASSLNISVSASTTPSVTSTISPTYTSEVATASPYIPHVYLGTTPIYQQFTTQAVVTPTPSPVPTDTPTPTAIATITTLAPTTPIETTTTVPINTTVTTSPPTTTAPTTTSAPTTATTTATNSCSILPIRGFGSVYNGSATIANKIGCATEHERQITEAYLAFEHGFMFYEQDTDQIWVFYGQSAGSWYVYQNTWNSSLPAGHGLTPPSGLYEPMRGFGKIWYDNHLQAKLGWATQPNESSTALGAAERFANGLMLYNPNLDVLGVKRIYVLYNNDGTFVNVVDSFQG